MNDVTVASAITGGVAFGAAFGTGMSQLAAKAALECGDPTREALCRTVTEPIGEIGIVFSAFGLISFAVAGLWEWWSE